MKSLMLALVTMFAGMTLVTASPAVFADQSGILTQTCEDLKKTGRSIDGCTNDRQLATNSDNNPSLVKRIINVFFYAVGLISFIFVVIGGIRYLTSTGNSQRIQSAKDTVLYAVIGLIVAILAIPISEYVIKKAGG